MPSSKAQRDLAHERNLARRIQSERERRGLSYDALAKAVTQAGCRMHPSTPFKIEKGDPPRRITIDEFVAFSKVFEISLEELLVPPEAVEDEEVTELMERYAQVLKEADKPVAELSSILSELSARLGGVVPATTVLRAYTERSVLDVAGLPGLERPGRRTAERPSHG